jgi:hypothetical protein
VWAAVHAATRRLAEQTTNALDTRALAARLDARYRNVDLRQRAGHMFELMHAHGFNRDAIKQGSRLRARVTNWDGAPAAAADLHIVDGARVVAEGRPSCARRSLTLRSTRLVPATRACSASLPPTSSTN